MRPNRGSQHTGRKAMPFGMAAICALGLLLAGCSGSRIDPKYGVASSPRVVAAGQPIPKGGGSYRVGKPYVVAGRNYVPEANENYRAEGIASWYGDAFHGRLTANGEVFDKEAISAAHPTLPMPSYVRVTNLQNKKSLIVRVNDRGPFHSDRVIDLSHKAADLLEFNTNGTARVRVEYVAPASLEGSDDRRLLATLRNGEPAPAPVYLASAKPVLPLTRSGRGNDVLPLPGARPYSLGEQTAALPSDEVTSAARVQKTANMPGISQVSAAAAPRYDASVGVISGRGLY
jgi:rare lipoprotein A